MILILPLWMHGRTRTWLRLDVQLRSTRTLLRLVLRLSQHGTVNSDAAISTKNSACAYLEGALPQLILCLTHDALPCQHDAIQGSLQVRHRRLNSETHFHRQGWCSRL